MEWISVVPFVVEEMADWAELSFSVLLSTRNRFMPWEAQSLATARPTPGKGGGG